ncbi:MAG: hypothetical protein N2749_00210 [Clostridia bacterium]|nr:hypothetical protein [Clostridia bacterium]
MRLFINVERFNVEKFTDDKIAINLLNTENKTVRLVLPISLEIFNQNKKYSFTLYNVSLDKNNNNELIFKKIKKTKENRSEIYILIQSTNVVPDDVIIASNMVDKVDILQKFIIPSSEVDYGDYMSNIYLLKLRLNSNETFPIYLTSENSFCLTDHFVFYRVSGEKIKFDLFKTYIILNKRNRKDYISLSKI